MLSLGGRYTPSCVTLGYLFNARPTASPPAYKRSQLGDREYPDAVWLDVHADILP